MATTAAEAVKILNEAMELDPVAMNCLMTARVPVNESLSEHPTIQVRATGPKEYSMSALGLINGLFGARPDGWGYIAAMFDTEAGKITHFVVLEEE